MTAVATKRLWPTLVAYPAVGLGLGLADPALGRVAQQLGTKPGVATAVSVNVNLPLAAVATPGLVPSCWATRPSAGSASPRPRPTAG